MKKRTSDKSRIRVEIWVALIGLTGVVVTAIFGSPVLIKLLERTPVPTTPTETASLPTFAIPIPTSANTINLPTSAVPVSTPANTAIPVSSRGCEPAGVTELPQQAVAVVESIEGVTARIPLSSLRYYRASHK